MAGRVISLGDEDDAAREEALAEAERREASQTEDFDAFWSAQERKATSLRNVFGVDVTLPAALPLRFEVEARKVAESSSEDDTKRMVGILFGDDALDRWTAAGMDVEQFAVLLLWGTANTRAPNSMTLAEAKDAMERQQEAKAQGKELVTTSGGESSATGPRSKRTSRASTGSRKRK
jgi:hypothetical protein